MPSGVPPVHIRRCGEVGETCDLLKCYEIIVHNCALAKHEIERERFTRDLYLIVIALSRSHVYAPSHKHFRTPTHKPSHTRRKEGEKGKKRGKRGEKRRERFSEKNIHKKQSKCMEGNWGEEERENK